jgi:hypothetical protein
VAESERDAPAAGSHAAAQEGGRIVAVLTHPRLPRRLALLATLLTAPTLAIGFHLDDYVHRYLLSDLPGSAALMEAYESPFGIANGDPEVNHWQVEEGYAPWWIDEHLLISLFRPISEASHRLDALLWPASAPLQHAHSLLWFFGLVLVTTRLYRGLMGPTTLAAVAAIFYALDHTHGFAVGWIANRNAIIAAFFGVLSLWTFDRGRRGAPGLAMLSPLLLACALLGGEGSVAIVGYLLAYALFLDDATPLRRLASVTPHLVVVALWRISYNALGHGARGSGLYLDPVREPLEFLAAALERAPLLLLGQIGLPPAEAALFLPAPWPLLIHALALGVAVWLLVSVWPLLRADATARFWSAGMLLSLVPACTTHPNNRLLFFVGLGAFGLLSQLWHGLLDEAGWVPSSRGYRRVARPFAALATGFHLMVSPLLLPVTACSILLTAPAGRAAEQALSTSAGRDLVVVSAPDYFHVKLVPVLAALRRQTPPERLRAVSFGDTALQVTRTDATTLHVRYARGILADPLLELYRDRDTPMPVGTRVSLAGLDIEVRALTGDGRVSEARFRFDCDLDDPRFRFLAWNGEAYVRWQPPPPGDSVRVAPAPLGFGL